MTFRIQQFKYCFNELNDSIQKADIKDNQFVWMLLEVIRDATSICLTKIGQPDSHYEERLFFINEAIHCLEGMKLHRVENYNDGKGIK